MCACFILGACRDKEDLKESMEVGQFLQKIQATLTSTMAGSGLLSDDVRGMLVTEDGEVWIATDKGISSTFDGQGWHPYLDGAQGADNSIIALTRDSEGRIWAGTSGAIKRLDANTWLAFSFTQSGLRGSLTTVFGSSSDGIWVGTDKGFAFFNGADFQVGPGDSISTTSFIEDESGNLWRGTDQGLFMYEDADTHLFTVQNGLLSSNVRALARDDEGRIWVGTDKGISIYDTKTAAWSQIIGTTSIPGRTGLPFTDITRIVISNDTVLVGTTWGAGLRLPEDQTRWQYFAGKRWVPDNRITSVALAPDRALWMGTHMGIGRVAWVPMTLEEKARHYEEQTRLRHNRMGMVEGVFLPAPGDIEHFIQRDDDNDGQYTQMYVAAESFRYAVTRDPEARINAKESFEAMARLEQFPRELGNPGFHARSFVTIEKAGGDCANKGVEWITDTTGNFCFKTTTSSDEITGHMFGYSVFYDLAADENDKVKVRGVVSRLMNHLVDHGYQLWDMNGKPTEHGRWDPDHVNSELLKVKIDGKWVDAGSYWLEALEILSYLSAAYHITGERKFEDHYWKLVNDYGYDMKGANWQRAYFVSPQMYNFVDDELAFLAYYPLLMHQWDPGQRKIFMESISRVMETKVRQRNPFLNFVAGAAMERGYGLEGAVRTLKEFPWSLIEWTMLNSHRTDIVIWLTQDRFLRPNLQSKEVIAYDERDVRRWDKNPYEVDGDIDSDGRGELAATPWFLPYWMGRHHGLIKK